MPLHAETSQPLGHFPRGIEILKEGAQSVRFPEHHGTGG